jgi:hypothetical protein
MGKKILLGLLVLSAVCITVVLAGRVLIRHWETGLLEHKMARTTTGVVVDKQHVQFSPDQTTFLNDEGKPRPVDRWRKEQGEFRVFYTIDNFNQTPGHTPASLANAEQERFRKFGPRYTIVFEKEFLETSIGQRIEIVYRWATDREIEVITTNLKPGSPSK